MIDRPFDSCTPDSSDPTTDGFTNDDPLPKRWRLFRENFGAARRALYAAKAQLG